MISQIPPKQPEGPPGHSGGSLSCEPLTWPDIKIRGVELGGLEPPTPCLQSTSKLSTAVAGLAWSAQSIHPSPVVFTLVGVGHGCQLGRLSPSV
jgi:hypothetical protein